MLNKKLQNCSLRILFLAISFLSSKAFSEYEKLDGIVAVVDEDVVLAAVHHNGYALQFAGEIRRDDREVVVAAVTQCGLALGNCAELLRLCYVLFGFTHTAS